MTQLLRPQQSFYPGGHTEPIERSDCLRRVGWTERDLGESERHALAIATGSVDGLFIRPPLQRETKPTPQPFERWHQTCRQLGGQQVPIVAMTSVTALVCEDDLEFVAIEPIDEPGRHSDPTAWSWQRVGEPVVAGYESDSAGFDAAMAAPRTH